MAKQLSQKKPIIIKRHSWKAAKMYSSFKKVTEIRHLGQPARKAPFPSDFWQIIICKHLALTKMMSNQNDDQRYRVCRPPIIASTNKSMLEHACVHLIAKQRIHRCVQILTSPFMY